jgi:hypothetical protein
MNLLEDALRYEQLGWYVLPVHPTEKRPLVKWAGRKNQRPTPMEIKGWWQKWPTGRIGVATGSLSGIDVVDIDGPDAFEKCIALCGELPNTLSQLTGRPEGGRHLFFKHDEHGLKNQACGGLDLKTDGGLVIVAPSTHTSGRCYRWERINPIDDGLDELAEMPASLVEYFSKISRPAGSLTHKYNLATTEPALPGQRHERLTRLVGKWIHQGLDMQTIKHRARGWYEELQDKADFHVGELEKQVTDLLERYGNGEAGAPLGEITDQMPMEREKKTNDDCENQNEADQDEFPQSVMTGAAGKFSAIIGELIEAPKQFLYFSYLTALGLLISPRLKMRGILPTQPRLYTVLIGKSGASRKSSAISIILDHFQETVPEFKAILGVGSAEGLQKILNHHGHGSPAPCLLTFDEMRSFVGKCSIESSILLPLVNTLFESNRFEGHTKKSDFFINNAHIAFLAATTVATYERIYTPAFLNIGFINRVWIVPGSGQRKNPLPGELKNDSKTELQEDLRRVLLFDSASPFLITDEAQKRYEHWYFHELGDSVHATRLDTYSRRLMPLLAVNDFKSEIDIEIVEHVITLCNWQLQVRRRYDPIHAENKVALLEESIRRVLSRGPHTERTLKQMVHYSRYGIWLFNKAMENLQNAREISFDAPSKRWRLLCF